jgi:hypothetical protein
MPCGVAVGYQRFTRTFCVYLQSEMNGAGKGGGFIRGCIQKFPDWPPGARTANDTALCHYVQL